ncbi:MAG: M1 family metallopeptidase [Pyrinomonadaceae bacterium]
MSFRSFAILLLVVFLPVVTASAQTDAPPIEPGVSQELARWRAARYSDVRYKLNLTLEKMSPVLKGTIEIRVNVSPLPKGTIFGTGLNVGQATTGSMPPIVLDWRKIKGHEDKSTISNVTVNGKAVSISSNWPPADAGGSDYAEHLVFRDGVVAGENVIKLDFTSPILTSGSAITRYIDKEDGSEYIYSLFVPSDASTAFPVFDQPDLKARFSLQIEGPPEWKVVSNAIAECTAGLDVTKSNLNPSPPTASRETLDPDVMEALRNVDWRKVGGGCGMSGSNLNRTYAEFLETKPISTYVFAFAAGPWAEVSEPPAVAGGLTSSVERTAPAGNGPKREKLRSASSKADLQPPATAGDSDLATRVYVRRSQAEKFKPHAAEVFRLNREGIKFLEEYFDYNFPFPKYDIVLIPEFPFGGMEHAGATFLRESSVIFPQEPTANDHISRANVIFHEAAHQWFGDTVTMRWFDDLWLKEGFAEFMAYKTLERVMPQYNAWKAFYERNKPLAYQTDSTRGTTPIYQEIPNLSAAKSAYGNIVYRKAPSFLKQAEFYLGPDKFQTAVRTFFKKHEFGNAGWEDLVKEFEAASGKEELASWWGSPWVKGRGMPIFDLKLVYQMPDKKFLTRITQRSSLNEDTAWSERIQVLITHDDGKRTIEDKALMPTNFARQQEVSAYVGYTDREPRFVFPNHQDYGYGIFLLDDKSRDYVLKNIQNEKDDFLRSMMWGSLWDSVREGELDPREYVELAIKNIGVEKDELTIQTILGRVSTAMTYYMPSSAGTGSSGVSSPHVSKGSASGKDNVETPPTVGLQTRLEAMLIDRMRTAPTLGNRITFYRAFLSTAATENARNILKQMLTAETPSRGDVRSELKDVYKDAPTVSASMTREQAEAFKKVEVPGTPIPLKTKDRFDIVTKLAILNDPDAATLLADLEKKEISDDAKRYAYAARAAFPTKENRERFWSDFVNNKDTSESWIEAALSPFNSPRHAELSLPYLERALNALPDHKRNRKIFFVNSWLAAFIGGQRSQAAVDIVNKFLNDNPSLDRDLRLKVLENLDIVERAVKIRAKFGGSKPPGRKGGD